MSSAITIKYKQQIITIMHRKNITTLCAAVLITLGSCANNSKKQNDSADVVNVTHELGKTTVSVNPKKVFVYDMGTLESLQDLGIPVAGIPKDFVPPHLQQYKDDTKVADVGSILQPNFEKVSTLNPDLIIISALHSNDYKQLTKIAPTISLGVDNNNYKGSVVNNLNRIGEIFDIKDKTDQKIQVLEEEIENAKKVISTQPKKIMILLYNAGKYSTFGSKSRYGFVFSDLKAIPADENIETDLHGTVVSGEYISKVNPDVLYIIDRNAIMPNYKVNKSEIENMLVQKTNAYMNKAIYYLDPNIWYLSGGGTYSMNHMIADILQGYH